MEELDEKLAAMALSLILFFTKHGTPFHKIITEIKLH
jgi:hypothetical protein